MDELPQDHRAKIVLDAYALQHYLDLPEGLHIRAIDRTNDPVAIVVHVEGDLLPTVDPRVESPRLDGIAGIQTVIVDRRVYRRWNWSPADPIDEL